MKFVVGICFLSLLLILPKFALGQSAVCDPYKDYDCLLQNVIEVVNNWANAWVEHDVARYLAAYAANISPLDNVDYSQWKKNRTGRVGQPKAIRVDITMLEVKPLSENNIGVQFIQQYTSQGYSYIVVKQLIINADFKIVKERIVSKMSSVEAAEMINRINKN
jgi:hypothetical protein